MGKLYGIRIICQKICFKMRLIISFCERERYYRCIAKFFKRLLDWEKSIVQGGEIFKILLTKIMIYLARKAERLPLARGMSTFSHSIQIPFIVSV